MQVVARKSRLKPPGLRKSGEFNLLGHVNPSSAQVQALAEPDVVLVDDMGASFEAVELISQMRC